MKMYWNKNIVGLKYPIWVWDQSMRLTNISIYTNTPKKIPSTSYIYSFCLCNIKLDTLRTSPIHNTILVWKLHHFVLYNYIKQKYITYNCYLKNIYNFNI